VAERGGRADSARQRQGHRRINGGGLVWSVGNDDVVEVRV
jgi:hypothetical protein